MRLWLWVMAVAFLAQFVKGVIGFASALIGIPLMGLAMTTPEAIALTLVIDATAGSWLVWDARHKVALGIVAVFLVSMFPAQWVGTGLLAWLDPATTRMGLAAFVVLMAARIAFRQRRSGEVAEPDRRAAVVAGLGAGLMQGLVGMPGPPLVAWTSRYLEPANGRAVLIWTFFPAAITTVGMLFARGLIETDHLQLAFAAVPAALLGGIAGSRVSPHVPETLFTRGVAVVLTVSAGALWFGG
jgi:uncharacterized membrane protein YfcA